MRPVSGPHPDSGLQQQLRKLVLDGLQLIFVLLRVLSEAADVDAE